MLVEGLHKSFYALSPFTMNSFFLEKSNPKDNDDYLTKSLRENSKNLSSKISSLQSDFQIFYEFFQFWKALFSEKIDRESRDVGLHKSYTQHFTKNPLAIIN